MNALRLGKYLKKYRSYGIFVGMDMGGKVAAIPMNHIHIDESHRALMLVIPAPMPKRQLPSSAIVKPRIELGR